MKTDCVLLVGHTTSGQSPPPLRNKKIDHDLLCVSLGGPYNIVTQMIFFFEKDKIKSEKMRTFQNGFQSRHCHRPHFDGTKWFHQVGGEKEENAKWIPCCCNNVHPPHHRNRRMKCKSMAITQKGAHDGQMGVDWLFQDAKENTQNGIYGLTTRKHVTWILSLLKNCNNTRPPLLSSVDTHTQKGADGCQISRALDDILESHTHTKPFSNLTPSTQQKKKKSVCSGLTDSQTQRKEETNVTWAKDLHGRTQEVGGRSYSP